MSKSHTHTPSRCSSYLLVCYCTSAAGNSLRLLCFFLFEKHFVKKSTAHSYFRELIYIFFLTRCCVYLRPVNNKNKLALGWESHRHRRKYHPSPCYKIKDLMLKMFTGWWLTHYMNIPTVGVTSQSRNRHKMSFSSCVHADKNHASQTAFWFFCLNLTSPQAQC